MKIILLPGLDGTGDLFEPLIEKLPGKFDIQIISYDTKKEQSYDDLTQSVLEQLPKEAFIIIAESFSGPIAYQIALQHPNHLKSIIFVATFLENPRIILLKILNILPLKFLFALPIPTSIIKTFLLGKEIDEKAILLFKNTFKKLDPKIISFRLQEIANLPKIEKKLNLNITYIQATKDKLVPDLSIKKFKKAFKNVDVYKIAAPHLVLQAKPQYCTKIINNTIMLHDEH